MELLKGKKGIITGALDQNSIAWKIAEFAKEEGAEFVLTNAPIALRKGDIYNLAKSCGSEVVPADLTDITDIENLYLQSTDILGGKIDFMLHSIGMSPNVRKNRPYEDLDYDYFLKTIDISAISFHKMLQTAYKMDIINEWGSVIALSYIGAQRTFYSYSDMSQAKAMLESIARHFGYIYGKAKKVRINTVSQSPTATTAGSGVLGFDAFYGLADCMSPIGNASAEDCAKYCLTLFSDYSKMVTMQNLFHDGGFSNMGISSNLVNSCNTCGGNLIGCSKDNSDKKNA